MEGVGNGLGLFLVRDYVFIYIIYSCCGYLHTHLYDDGSREIYIL